MSHLLDTGFVVLMLLNFVTLGASRLRVVIQAVALQGVLLGILPLAIHADITWPAMLVVMGTLILKGLVLPRMLFWALRDLRIRREIEPLISLTASLILGAIGTALSLAFADSLPLAPGHGRGLLLVPASLATVFTGFVLLTTRLKALTQVLGYLVLENGIFIFGLLLIEAMPFLVEIGVLLDLFVAIVVMGIVINNINRTFSTESTEHLTALKD
jgi:hydrogenase-4 component E